MSTNIFNSTRPVSTNKMNQTKPFVITDAQAPQAQQNQQQGQKSSVIGPLFFDFKTMSFQPMFDFNKPLVDQQNQWINLQKQKPAQTEEQQPAAANQTVKAQALQPKPEQQKKADLFPEAQGDTAVNSAAAPAGQKDTTDYSQAALEQKMKEQGVVAPQRQYTNQDWDNFRKSRFGQRDDVTVDDDPDTAINMYKSLGVLTDKEKDQPEMVQTAKSKPQDVTYVHPDYREEATKQMFDNYEADKKNVGRLRKLYDTTVDLDQQMLEKRNEAFHEVYDNKDPLAKKNAEHGSWWNPTGILTGLGSALFSKKVYNPETQTYENKAPSDWHELTQNLVRNVATLGSGVHIGRRGRQYTAGYDPTMPMSLLRQQRADAYAPYAEREALRSQLAQDAIRPTTKPWQLDQPYPGVSHPMEGYARAQIETEMGFRAVQETMKRISQLRGWTPDSQEYIELENQLLGLTPSILQKARWYIDGLRKTNQFSDQELNRAYVDFLMKEYTGQSLTEQEQAKAAAEAKALDEAIKRQREQETHEAEIAYKNSQAVKNYADANATGQKANASEGTASKAIHEGNVLLLDAATADTLEKKANWVTRYHKYIEDYKNVDPKYLPLGNTKEGLYGDDKPGLTAIAVSFGDELKANAAYFDEKQKKADARSSAIKEGGKATNKTNSKQKQKSQSDLTATEMLAKMGDLSLEQSLGARQEMEKTEKEFWRNAGLAPMYVSKNLAMAMAGRPDLLGRPIGMDATEELQYEEKTKKFYDQQWKQNEGNISKLVHEFMPAIISAAKQEKLKSGAELSETDFYHLAKSVIYDAFEEQSMPWLKKIFKQQATAEMINRAYKDYINQG